MGSIEIDKLLGDVLSALSGQNDRGRGNTSVASTGGLFSTNQEQSVLSIRSLVDSLTAPTRMTAAVSAGTSLLSGDMPGISGSAIIDRFSGGLPMLGLARSLIRLFTGGSAEPSTLAPVRFELPEPLRLEAGLGAEVGPRAVDFDQFGRPRLGASPRMIGAPVSIQVQAVDSRSFLDHSDEIARAVREALLNSHALSDVLLEG